MKTRSASADAAPGGPVLDLNTHIATKVAVFANRLSRAASRFYRARFGIGVVEWRLMMFVGYVHETCANQICRETDLDKGAVSRSLNVLARMGIVGIREDGTDSRRHKIALTAKGRALHDRLVPVAIERQRELVSGLTSDEVAVFANLVDRLRARVSDGAPGNRERPSKPRPAARTHRKRDRRDDPPRRPASAP
ncbi:MAG: winged helix-turn-helix transcriptional regulator [Hyphomicrobiaceae bacterium]|nr:winged helix-turn-helix transcriptional regulator [Hyphomicrobiaceae bacterium]